ncbi:MAG: cytochrome c-type biogenesis protein CcmH, partial [Actinomycetota bacterium]
LEARAQALMREIRCTVCENEPVSQSTADMAVDARRRIREEIAKGASDSEVRDFFVSRFGQYTEFLRTLRQSALGDAVVPVVSDSELFGAQFTTDLSFLFIDGGHGESPTKRDYETWTPKIAPRGYLAIHDVFADPKDGGQAPHDFIYRRALDSGLFTQVSAKGSLRVLRRRDEVQPSRVSS